MEEIKKKLIENENLIHEQVKVNFEIIFSCKRSGGIKSIDFLLIINRTPMFVIDLI